MLDPSRRRLSLSDTSILIAATAFGLVIVRYFFTVDLWALRPAPVDRFERIMRILTVAMHLASPVLVALSLAAFAIDLRPPRPPLRRLAREPGFVAMAVVSLTTSYFLVHFAARECGSYDSTPPMHWTNLSWVFANLFVGLGWNVAIAWFVLALQGHWRPRSLFTGGIGAALGCTWIAAGILHDSLQLFRIIYYNYL